MNHEPGQPVARRSGWWQIAVASAGLYGPVAIILAWPAARWLVSGASRLVNYVSILAIVLFIASLAMHLLSHAAKHKEAASGEHGSKRGLNRWVAVVLSASLALGAKLSEHFAVSDLHHHIENAFPKAEELYANHDVAKLVGQTVQVIVLKSRDVTPRGDRTRVTQLAAVIPEHWRSLADRHDPRIVPLTEQQLWQFIRNPDAKALSSTEWKSLLDEWAAEARVQPLVDQTKENIARELTSTFAFAWREALKHNYEHGGKAWAAMQLDLIGELLRGAGSAGERDPDLKSAVASLADLPPFIQDLRAEVKRDQSELARSVTARLDDVQNMLAGIARDASAARQNTDALTRAVVINADPGLSDQQKFERILKLFEPQPVAKKNEGGAQAPAPKPTGDVAQFIERMAANASLIDRIRAMNALGKLEEAKRFSAQYQAERKAQRDAEDFAFQTALGDTHWLAREFDAAAQAYREALRIRQDDAQALTRAALSLFRARQSTAYGADLAQAEQWLRQSLKLSRDAHSGDSPEVARAIGNLAVVVHEQGREQEAEQLYREALDLQRRIHPGDHLEVASALGDLSLVVANLGKLEEADRLIRESIAMRRRIAKVDDVFVAEDVQRLVHVLRESGKVAEAEPAARESLAIFRRALPADAPEVVSSINALGLVLSDLGKLAEAEPLLRESLETTRRTYRGDHPLVASKLINFGVVLYQREKIAEAEAPLREALTMCRRLFPDGHPDTASCAGNLGEILDALGRPTESLAMMQEALAINRKLHPGDHPDIALCLNNLAGTFHKLARDQEAESVLREALDVGRRLFPGDHPYVAGCMRNLGAMLDIMGQSSTSEPLLKDAIAMRRRMSGESDPELVSDLLYYGVFLRNAGRSSEAEKVLESSIEMCKKLSPGESARLGYIISHLAAAERESGKVEVAEVKGREGIAMMKRSIKTDNVLLAESLAELGLTLSSAGKKEEALRTIAEASGMIGRIVPEGHSTARRIRAAKAALDSK